MSGLLGPAGFFAAQVSEGAFQVTIASGTVGSNLTDFPLLVDLSEMPPLFWSTVTSGGGNIRAYEADGTTQIPFEVVAISTSGQTGQMFALTDISSGSDTSLIIKTEDGATALAVTDTYGRNAVWSGYEAVYHLSDGVDATGNGNTVVVDGTSPEASFVSGSTKLAGYLSSPSDGTGADGGSFDALATEDLAFSAFARISTLPSTNFLYSYIFAVRDGSDGWGASFRTGGAIDLFTFGANTSAVSASAVISTGVDSHVAGEFLQSSGDARTYVNGSVSVEDTSYSNTSVFSSAPVYLAASNLNENGFPGRIWEFRLKKGGWSTDWVAAEYANMNDPASFYTIATV